MTKGKIEKLEVTLIIPIYNAEKYLVRCLDSIIAQTLTNWECILVDDGSTDNSLAICNEYAARDARFHVLHKANGGASSARNAGIEAANAEYICFIDDDDELMPRYIESLYREMKTVPGTDLVVQGFISRSETRDTPSSFGNLSKSYTVCRGEEDFRQDENMLNPCNPFGKVYRRSLLKKHSIRFRPDLIIGEDYEFLLRYLQRVHRVCISPEINYIYHKNEGSVSHRLYCFDVEYRAFKMIQEQILQLDIDEKMKERRIGEIADYFFDRLLLTIYQGKMKRTERIRSLKLLRIQAKHIQNAAAARSRMYRVTTSLMNKRAYGLLDLLLWVRLYNMHKGKCGG